MYMDLKLFPYGPVQCDRLEEASSKLLAPVCPGTHLNKTLLSQPNHLVCGLPHSGQ